MSGARGGGINTTHYIPASSKVIFAKRVRYQRVVDRKPVAFHSLFFKIHVIAHRNIKKLCKDGSDTCDV